MNKLQYRDPAGHEEDGREMPDGPSGQANDLEPERQVTLSADRVHINHVDTLIIQHGPAERDIEGQTYMRGL